MRVAGYFNDAPFWFTYGESVADVDLTALINLHRCEGRWATLTAVQPPGCFGSLAFEEKSQGDGSWINGGFYF